MDIGSSIVHQLERRLNACLTCLVMRHGTYGFQVNTKEALGIAGFSNEVLETLSSRLHHHEKTLATQNNISLDEDVYDLSSDTTDWSQLPQWLLVIVTEKELLIHDNVNTLCRWYRRLKSWKCDCLVVVLSSTAPPSCIQKPESPIQTRDIIPELCSANPELRELRALHRLRTFHIPHWDTLESVEPGFLSMVQHWLTGPVPVMGSSQHDVDHLSYTDIFKMLARELGQSLPHMEIFFRLLTMCVLGLASVVLTLMMIVAMSRNGGLENDIRRAQAYLVGHLESRRTGKSEWGRTHNSMILSTLQLHNAHWCFDIVDNQRSVDRLEIGILASLTKLSSRTKSIHSYTPQRLAGDINALLATFQNPRDFHDHDLVAILKRYVTDVLPYMPYTAHAYSSYVIALCNSGEFLDVRHANRILDKAAKDGSYYLGINEATVALVALSCVEKTEQTTLDSEKIVRYIRRQRHHDGSYGSVHTTALVIQAYESASTSIDTVERKEATLAWLARNSYTNMALKDPDVASAVLLALSGKNVVAISNFINLGEKIYKKASHGGQQEKYRFLTPDVTPGLVLQSKEGLLPKRGTKQIKTDDTALENSSDTTIGSQNQNIKTQNETHVDDQTTDNTERVASLDPAQHSESDVLDKSKTKEHRWKKWRKISALFSEEEEDDNDTAGGAKDLKTVKRNGDGRIKGYCNSTFNEQTLQYRFLQICIF